MANGYEPSTYRTRHCKPLLATILRYGLVKTSENFGIQGEAPTNPELLDWLATEFIRIGWDMKALQKLIVTSSTYRKQLLLTEFSNEGVCTLMLSEIQLWLLAVYW